MSEGANVTTGVANPDVVLPPEKPQKRKGQGEFEKEITAAVSQSAKKKVDTLLENVGAKLGVGDKVEVDGKAGRVVGMLGSGPTAKVNISFADGTQHSYEASYAHIKVIQRNPQYIGAADSHYRDAQAAKRGSEPARMHQSMAKYHDWMAKHHDWEGNEDKAKEHRAKSEESTQEAEKSLKIAAEGRGFVPTREARAKDKQNLKDHQSAQKTSKQTTYQHYYVVPFADKDKAKAKGLKWDPQEKKWYQPSEVYNANKSLPWKYSHTWDNHFGKKHT